MVACSCEEQANVISPYSIVKFDCKNVNTIRTVANEKNHLMIAGCSDSFVKFIDLKTFNIIRAIRSVFGAPLCMDISPDFNFLAVGYEDDSISLIDINEKIPVLRLTGHCSFVNQVKFDVGAFY